MTDYAQARLERAGSPREVRRDRQFGVGCLVALGIFGLLPLLPLMFVVARSSIQGALDSIVWTNLLTICRSLWEWLRHGSGDIYTAFAWVFGLGYCVLVWQWIAYRIGWRTFLPDKRLWAASSIYFFVVLGSLGYLGFDAAGEARDRTEVAVTLSIIPIVFLTLTLPLWHLSIRRQDEPTDADTGTGK